MAENDNRNCLPGNYSRNACKRLSLWSWAGLCFSGNTRAAADHQCPELPVPDPVHFQTLQGGQSHRGRKLQREPQDDSAGRSPTSRDWQCKKTNKPTLGQEPEPSFYRTTRGYWSFAGYEGDVLVEEAPEHALQCKAGITGKSKTRLKKMYLLPKQHLYLRGIITCFVPIAGIVLQQTLKQKPSFCPVFHKVYGIKRQA